MKKVTVDLEGSTSLISIYVNGDYEGCSCDHDTLFAIEALGGKALVIPSRHGEMSLRFDGDAHYDIWDGRRDTSDYLCADAVEDVIGTRFRKKHFTFYLREV